MSVEGLMAAFNDITALTRMDWKMSEFGSHDYDEYGHELVEYGFDEGAASKADEGRIDTSGAYVFTITRAEATTSAKKGTQGVTLAGLSEGNGDVEFTLWTRREDGSPIFGFNQLQAIMAVTGVRGLCGAKGKVMAWDEEEGGRMEKDGTVFPDLIGKKVGLVMQKELYTGGSGKTSFRMNCVGAYHHESHLTASELKDRKVKPEKLEKMLARLKDKDSRTGGKEEEASPVATVGSGF